jgi:hypothetical protein
MQIKLSLIFGRNFEVLRIVQKKYTKKFGQLRGLGQRL